MNISPLAILAAEVGIIVFGTLGRVGFGIMRRHDVLEVSGYRDPALFFTIPSIIEYALGIFRVLVLPSYALVQDKSLIFALAFFVFIRAVVDA